MTNRERAWALLNSSKLTSPKENRGDNLTEAFDEAEARGFAAGVKACIGKLRDHDSYGANYLERTLGTPGAKKEGGG